MKNRTLGLYSSAYMLLDKVLLKLWSIVRVLMYLYYCCIIFQAINCEELYLLTDREGKHKSLTRYKTIHDLIRLLKPEHHAILLSAYCLYGCDTTSSFIGHGKKEVFRDQKKLCCLMNNLMGRDSPTSLPSSESDTQLALDFSRFFQPKVLRIREELDGTPVHGDYSVEFHPQQSVRSLFLKFNPVDELSIRRYIRELNKTYCSLDPINVSKITVAFEAAAPFIASLVNKYFEECIFCNL